MARLRHAGVAIGTSLLLATLAAAKPVPTPGGGSHASRAAKKPCAAGMIEVEGDYCSSIEHTCAAWLPSEKGVPSRCAEFEGNGVCTGAKVKKHFCIDKFEFPNEPGRKPAVMKSWQDAQEICSARGKRLCKESEWTLACEGPDLLPYPHGTKRDANICNIDKPQIDLDEKRFADPSTRSKEVAKLWQGEPSGYRTQCVSPFGVRDMTGNVDEWVVNESGKPFRSALKGGYWGPVRAACRPSTVAHGETFPFYQTGFRCCADPVAR